MTEEIAERFFGGEAQAREAFEELCAMVHNLQVIETCRVPVEQWDYSLRGIERSGRRQKHL